jgi:hypothetical protein
MIKPLFFFAFSFSFLSALAQEGTVASGGEAVGVGGQLSYSVGQVVYTSNTNKEGISVSQGIQQAYEIIRTGGNPESSQFATVYPNPVTDYLVLEVTGYSFHDLRCELYDAIGKFISSQVIISDKTYVDMSLLAAGTYSLAIYQSSTQFDTFKIIKYQ